MTLNPYFSNNNFYDTAVEQALCKDLIDESIQIYGINCKYIPRTIISEDDLYGDDVLSKFENGYELEVYLPENKGFSGAGALVSKFGLELRDQSKFIISKRRFDTEVLGRTRPMEGDLIYFPLTTNVFEIKFVEHESIFYQIGEFYVYELSVELFEYSHERFETGNNEIDSFEAETAYSINLAMSLGGTGNYSMFETVYQGANLDFANVSGKVFSWNVSDRILTVGNVTGDFSNNTVVIGVNSNARWTYTSSNTLIDMIISPNIFDDNKLLEEESIDYINLNDINNPYGVEF